MFAVYLLNPWSDFDQISLKWKLHLDNMQYPCPANQASRSSSKFYSTNSCQLYIFWTLDQIFIKFHSNVHCTKIMCITSVRLTRPRGQGQSFISHITVYSLSFESLISFWSNFTQMYNAPRRCVEPMSHSPAPQGQGHRFIAQIPAHPICFEPLLRFFIKIHSNVHYTKMTCRTYVPFTFLQSQSQSFMTQISFEPLIRFSSTLTCMYTAPKWLHQILCQSPCPTHLVPRSRP